MTHQTIPERCQLQLQCAYSVDARALYLRLPREMGAESFRLKQAGSTSNFLFLPSSSMPARRSISFLLSYGDSTFHTGSRQRGLESTDEFQKKSLHLQFNSVVLILCSHPQRISRCLFSGERDRFLLSEELQSSLPTAARGVPLRNSHTAIFLFPKPTSTANFEIALERIA